MKLSLSLIVTTFCLPTAAFAVSPSTDGTVQTGTSSSSSSVTLASFTTTGSSGQLVIWASSEKSTGAFTVSSITGTGCATSWTKRSAIGSTSISGSPTTLVTLEEWYCPYTSTQTNVQPVVNFSGTSDSNWAIIEAFKGACASAPWDPLAALTTGAISGTGTSPTTWTTVSHSTNNADDLLVGAISSSFNGSMLVGTLGGSAASLLTSVLNNGGADSHVGGAQTLSVATPTNGTTTFQSNNPSAGQGAIVISDALTADCPAAGGTPTRGLLGVGK